MTPEELKKLEAIIAEQIEGRNNAPNPDIDNLSPIDMSKILYETYTEGSPIGIKKDVPNEVYEKIPFIKGARMLFNAVGEKGLKLTPKGSLPRKLSHDIFHEIGVSGSLYDATYKKSPNQDDIIEVTNVKVICELAGLTKKRHGKLTLTKNGEKLSRPKNVSLLFEKIFTTNYKKFNLGYHDGYPDKTGFQNCFGYTLYMLLRYGNEMKTKKFYANKNLVAFPMLPGDFIEDSSYSTPEGRCESAYWVRIFLRFLKYYGFLEFQGKAESSWRRDENIAFKASDLFFEIFELKEDKLTGWKGRKGGGDKPWKLRF